jgi:hypothetical protein
VKHGLDCSFLGISRNVSDEKGATSLFKFESMPDVDELPQFVARDQTEEAREPIRCSKVCPKAICVTLEDVQTTELVKTADRRP